ncbi:DNA polymerase III subunit beta [Patescibacteria group bacterium]|nr:DNA polymerase III subunit beta [Patescibacteria group bacterium]MBU1074957.1 DNA polymerase III subunit beta [Patescibacteria group bacterium]MBU1951440.1 DNA polymerase III subunit beta [Patescibacteria group bacterium]
MKLYCTQENLNRGLNIVSHLAGKNTTLPILDNILVSIENGEIQLSTTNLEMGISCKIRGKVEREGKITIPAKLLSDYISLLPNEKIFIEETEKKIYISCTDQETTIQGMSAGDYPLIPSLEKRNKILIKTEDLKNVVRETLFAAAYDETRPEISGVLIKIEGNKARFVATDSYRLAEKTIEINAKESEDVESILPSRTLQELVRVMGATESEDVEMYIAENQVLFCLNDIEIISRAIEGNYPDYQQIIPKEKKTGVLANKEDLLKVIKTTSLFSKSGINDVNIKVVKEKKELIVSAINSQLGENISRLHVDVEGEDNEIVFNHRYLLDGLQNINSERVSLEIINNTNPGVIRPEKDESYTYIIMPIKQ